MKIATFNVNSLRKRLPIVLDWLARQKPDVLCLQETKVQDSEFPLLALAESGYRNYLPGDEVVQRRRDLEPEEAGGGGAWIRRWRRFGGRAPAPGGDQGHSHRQYLRAAGLRDRLTQVSIQAGLVRSAPQVFREASLAGQDRRSGAAI